jgi:hypothetical protein
MLLLARAVRQILAPPVSISNHTLARCEEQLALAVPRPTSLISITGLN